MTYCLNPVCTKPQNPDGIEFCQSCQSKLTPRLRNRYRIIKPLGQGGFGRTYLAVDEDRLNTRCVIKQFSPQVESAKSLEKAVRLFDQEAMRLHELGEHPQIPTLLAYFEHEKWLYLVQQFIEGPTLLQEMQQQGTFDEPKVRGVLAGVLPVLKYVHDHHVIHRDITPSNIIRRQLDNKLVLIDFGVAKLLSTEAAAGPGTKIGTEGYAPMEQLRSGKAYPASDLYSLAATCLYLMTRTKPDDLFDPLEGRWLWRDRLHDMGSAMSDLMGRILDKMLKDLVSERYQSADAVMKDLRVALSRPSALGEPPTGTAADPPAAATSVPPSSAPRPSAPAASGGSTTSRTPRPNSRPPISASRSDECLQVITGHSRWVLAVAISPNDQMIASAGLDDVIKLWNLQTGELLQTFAGHTRAINCLAFTPDGKHLVSGSDDNTVRIWQLQSGKTIRVLTGHTRDITCLSVHDDGRLLATGSEDRTARIWNLATGDVIHVLHGVAGIIRSVNISPDAQLLAAGRLDSQIRIWRIKTGEEIRSIRRGHYNAVNAVKFGTSSKFLVSAGRDKTIKIWDLSKGEAIRTLSGHTDSVNAIALSRDGRKLFSGGSDTALRLWDPARGSVLRTFTDHTNAVNAVALSGNGQIGVSGSSDNTVRVWRLP